MGPNEFADDYAIEDHEDFAHDELERDWDEPYEPEYYEHDDMHDIESAMGSIGWGHDEYYGGHDY